jgi:RNA polymerase sigma factor (TIGR02999 family)
MEDSKGTGSAARDSLTTLLHAWRDGSGTAFGSVIDQVYDQLRAMAASRVNRSGGMLTVSPTELLHEVLLKVMPEPMDWNNRAHFFATMSLTIRSVLVDHARARMADKRGGERIRVTLTDSGAGVGEESMAADLLALEQSLVQLEKLDERCGQVLHLTYFGGLAREEVAAILNISIPTVTRDLRFARAWIAKSMAGESMLPES